MIELTTFGSVVATLGVLAVICGLFPLGAWFIDEFDPPFPVFFVLFILCFGGAIALVLCIPMFWGAGFAGAS